MKALNKWSLKYSVGIIRIKLISCLKKSKADI